MVAKKKALPDSLAGEKKPALLRSLGAQMRSLAAQGALLGDAVGERVGLSGTDLECLELIANAAQEAMTPGQLATATGLSSGAVTGLIDRLERGGFVERVADPADRRRLRVVARPARVREVGAYYERLAQRTAALWSQYSEEQLRTVLDFLRRSAELSSAEIEHIRQLPALNS
jgi:DNA-binding MarR family transcriptional regulator